MRTILALALCVSACASDDIRLGPDPSTTTTTTTTLTEPPGFESGTRLRVRSYVGEDGSKELIGWRDAERNEICYFTKAADGAMRCQPNAAYAQYFSDAQCTKPAAMVQSCTTPPLYIRSLASASCADWSGPLYVAGATVGTTYSGAACTPSAVPAGYTAYSVGAEVPPTSFVAATEQVE